MTSLEIEERRRFPETLDQRSGEGRLADLSSADYCNDRVSRQELLETFLVSMALNSFGVQLDPGTEGFPTRSCRPRSC